MIKSFRGSIETTLQPGDGWSILSEEYIQSGTQFLSPSLRRCVQLEAEMLSTDPRAGIALDELALVYSRSLAHTALGEVHPPRVEPGAETDFTYFLRPESARNSQGFGAIALEASVPLTFREIRIDGTPIDVEITPTDAGLRLPKQYRLPRLLGTRERVGDLLRTGRSGRRRARNVRRWRRGLPARTRLDIGAGLLTPNGDGINDALEISFDVLKVIDARICDLNGRLVRTIEQRAGRGRPLFFVLGWSPKFGGAG